MRAYDWSTSPLGPVEAWPQSLRTSISTCLHSRFAMVVWWGPQLVMFYNDAYAPLCGDKHPSALGTPGREVWPEIWDIVGPMLHTVLERGEANWADDLLLLVVRSGYPEECYFTFSYSPILDESGGVGGVFTPVYETTERVIGERRLRTLRDLAAVRAGSNSATREDVCRAAAGVLGGNGYDVPFAAIYLADGGGRTALLAATAGTEGDGTLLPESFSLDEAAWIASAARTGSSCVLELADIPLGPLPTRPWDIPPEEAIWLPIFHPGRSKPAAYLFAGINVRKRLNEDYRAFFGMVAESIGSALLEVEMFEQERQRAQALSELDRAKTAFFTNISHEFRTPLTLMLGPLEEEMERAEGGEQLRVVHRNALRLLKLVNALLDFSRIEAGRSEASFEPTDLAAYTADLASAFRSATDKAGLQLIVECEPLRQPVAVDRGMWEKIVLNLLSNAFKFTFQGSICVRLRKEGGVIRLEVSDTGTGIAESELPRLFERFHRVEGAAGRSIEGTGIGLALVQELVKLHGGAIHVKSAPGKGSTFTVEIPAAHAGTEESGQAALPVSASGYVEEALRWLPGVMAVEETAERPLVDGQRGSVAGVLSGSRVLIADDNADMREYLKRLLEQHYQVTAVANGMQALTAALADPPDLVLTDVMMPELDGFALLKALREHPETRRVPVMMLSARAGEEARIEGLRAGVDDYLVKPFSARELLARVRAQLDLAGVRQEAYEREQALRAEAEAERKRIHTLFTNAPVPIIIMNGPEHRISFINDRYVRLVGRKSAAELRGKTIRQALPEAEAQPFFGLLDEVYRTGVPFLANEMLATLDREATGQSPEVWLNLVYQPTLDAQGQVDGIMVVVLEVTDQVLARREVQASEERFRAIVVSGSQSVWRHRPGVATPLDDPARLWWEEFTGQPQSSGEDWLRVLHPEDRERARMEWESALAGRYIYESEYRVRRADGEYGWVQARGVPLFDGNGAMREWVGTLNDVTDRRRAEEALRESEERFRFLAESVPQKIFTTDIQGEVDYYNRQWTKFTGRPIDEILGWGWTQLVHPEDRAECVRQWRHSISTGEKFEVEQRYRRADGVYHWHLTRALAMRDEQGQILRWISSSTDVHERRQAEEALRRSEKLAVVGRMAATISHEINNPLESVTNLLYLMRMSSEMPEMRSYLKTAEEELARVTYVVTHSLRFHRQSSAPRRERLSALLDSAIAVFQGRLRHTGVTLVRDYRDSEEVLCLGSELRQVFANMVGNAFDATAGGGTIFVRTRDALDRKTGLRGVRVTVADTGVGMSESTLKRLFEPFFTTKGLSGTGLGLWLSKEILEKHRATLHIRSREGKGTIFSIFCPLDQGDLPKGD